VICCLKGGLTAAARSSARIEKLRRMPLLKETRSTSVEFDEQFRKYPRFLRNVNFMLWCWKRSNTQRIKKFIQFFRVAISCDSVPLLSNEVKDKVDTYLVSVNSSRVTTSIHPLIASLNTITRHNRHHLRHLITPPQHNLPSPL
jgi:hypothetical protein